MLLMRRSLKIVLFLLAINLLAAQTPEIPEDISKVATRAMQFLKMEIGAEAAVL